MEVYVGYDKEKGCGIPTRLGTNFINQYLHGITGSKEYFIKFGYSKAQPNNYWPAEKYTCQFPLDGTANLTVNIKNNQQCTITNQL
ncbi:MAG: hypothetical protein A3I77_05245 [Gammaproteobacteria bacterium RIFCSPLOWO2_02_FULL_42_14]|nr:MAG: hypothetical protein A3B71_01810 [Gammaproteobacteria bacterium RIFCSPHIGHO2_02_FULL_42_43]OGT51181.1 MAG: hypothetical protein A3E54_03000 [Gammaproteobacteria bacterium RIFCSPHIGHO2_12_FULL_41_25]OGT62943.1 MAG: hypothetical protein A3I77_05245 [Gammaproteobacteria bacterium RIFCSPLOWO2_02_FULL_42_14]OGT86075.1 MAG: hypothetical protein A3G86_02800 [Gammaproteobacteria bacterium RIFCSPLOWO2_12_FULL_42_18]